MKDIYVVGKKMTRSGRKMTIIDSSFSRVFSKLKKVEMENFLSYAIAFDQIKILTCWAPQNDRLNLSFVKDVSVGSKKMTEKYYKIAQSWACVFWT